MKIAFQRLPAASRDGRPTKSSPVGCHGVDPQLPIPDRRASPRGRDRHIAHRSAPRLLFSGPVCPPGTTYS
eukprot:1745187-Prymnesium_polylepis.1